MSTLIQSFQKNEDELTFLDNKLNSCKTCCTKTPPKSKIDFYENSLTKLVLDPLYDLEINKIQHENNVTNYKGEVKENLNAETDQQKDDLSKLEKNSSNKEKESKNTIKMPENKQIKSSKSLKSKNSNRKSKKNSTSIETIQILKMKIEKLETKLIKMKEEFRLISNQNETVNYEVERIHETNQNVDASLKSFKYLSNSLNK